MRTVGGRANAARDGRVIRPVSKIPADSDFPLLLEGYPFVAQVDFSSLGAL